MNIEEFFALKESPFKTTVDEKYYFSSVQHRTAFNKIKYVIDTMGGLTVVIGGSGMGKSMLSRRLILDLNPKEYELGLIIIAHTGVAGALLLKQIAQHMGVSNASESDPVGTISALYKQLLILNQEKGVKPVILIDEANMFDKKEQMEELRGLMNLEGQGQKLINLVLLGIPELEHSLRLDPAFAQRVILKITLGPLQQGEVKAYINHRLRIAGGSEEIFDDDACDIIYNVSRGIPRLINTLCLNTLWRAKDMGTRIVNANIVTAVAKESLGHLNGI
jgi:type II secretory pathway predicted ATPase ExeA